MLDSFSQYTAVPPFDVWHSLCSYYTSDCLKQKCEVIKLKTLVLLIKQKAIANLSPPDISRQTLWKKYLPLPHTYPVLKILLLLSLLICTKYLCSHWLDLLPVIKRQESGVRGHTFLSLALWTNPDSGQFLHRSWGFVYEFTICVSKKEWLSVCVSVCRCTCVFKTAGMFKLRAVSNSSWYEDVFISLCLL